MKNFLKSKKNAFPFAVLGKDLSTTGCFDSDGIAKLSCIPYALRNIMDYAFVFSGIVAVIFLVWAGIRYAVSGGDEVQLSKAKRTMTFAIIGLVIILLSFFVIKLIGFVTGTTCIEGFSFEECVR